MPPVTGAKRSLFSKPAWAAKAIPKSLSDSDNNTSIFGQNSVYEDIVAAEQEKRVRHAARVKERAEKERLKNEKQAAQVSDSKRRRISKETTIDVDGSSESDKDAEREKSRSRSVTPAKNKPVLRSAPSDEKKAQNEEPRQISRSRTRQKNTSQSTAQDDDDDDLVIIGSSHHVPSNGVVSNGQPAPQAADPEPDEDDDDDDEYTRELKRKARAEAKKYRAVTHDAASPQTGHDLSDPTSTTESEPLVHIYIKTIIPNARPLLITRRINQPLDKVREFWCQRNDLAPAIASKIFFTWNGNRLFDSTTMRAPIERLKKIRPMPDGSDPSEGQIEIEAVTEEIFEYQKQQRERRKREQNGEFDNDDTNEGADGISTDANAQTHDAGDDDKSSYTTANTAGIPPPAVQSEKPGLVIKLTSPDREPIDLRVRPTSTMAKIITMYRRVHEIEHDRECWLVFDGEKLGPGVTVQDAEFEHEDTVEDLAAQVGDAINDSTQERK